MTTWPENLPYEFEYGGFQETFPNGAIATNMDAGPPKRRRRFTASVSKITGTILMTTDEVAVLDNFYRNTVREVEPFSFIHPRTGELVSMVITQAPQLDAYGPGLWRVKFNMEVQP